MNADSKIFYSFVGIHSFLIGLFPFYLPVYLWKQGHTLSNISFFIALTGIGFCLSLWGFERIVKRIPFSYTIFLSFVFEILLLTGGGLTFAACL